MSKTAKEKTKISIAADKAREAYTKAKEANEKNDNATTKKALDDAKTVRDTAVKAESRERFVNVGGARVGKVVIALGNVGKLAQSRSYEYGEEDIAKAETAINEAAKAAISALRAAKTGGAKAASTGFSF